MGKHNLQLGRIVHFVLPSGIPRPAIVVRVWDNDVVNLQVFTDGINDSALGLGTPANVVHQASIPHEVPTAAKSLSPATWHWPDERAAALAEGAIAEGMRGT